MLAGAPHPQNPCIAALVELLHPKGDDTSSIFSYDCLLAVRCVQPGDRHKRVIHSRMAANRPLALPSQPAPSDEAKQGAFEAILP